MGIKLSWKIRASMWFGVSDQWYLTLPCVLQTILYVRISKLRGPGVFKHVRPLLFSLKYDHMLFGRDDDKALNHGQKFWQVITLPEDDFNNKVFILSQAMIMKRESWMMYPIYMNTGHVGTRHKSLTQVDMLIMKYDQSMSQYGVGNAAHNEVCIYVIYDNDIVSESPPIFYARCIFHYFEWFVITFHVLFYTVASQSLKYRLYVERRFRSESCTYVWHVLEAPTSSLMLNLKFRQLFDDLYHSQWCFIQIKCHPHSQHHLISMFLYKAELPPPTDVGWSMNDGGISAVGRRRLEYELWEILTVGWGINYISHRYPLCANRE